MLNVQQWNAIRAAHSLDEVNAIVSAARREHAISSGENEVEACGAHEQALRAILADPGGCRFCDSGKLRNPNDPAKGHDPWCGYALAEIALGAVKGPHHRREICE